MVKLRLDFNGSYTLERAIKFCKMIEHMPIDYIEQPLAPHKDKDLRELSLETSIPIALDESIVDLDSLDKELENNVADVFVLKPMLIGGISKLSSMIDSIKDNSKRFNISSLLESNVGRLFYLHISSAFEASDPCGIGTNIFFKNDLCNFPSPVNGVIKINNTSGILNSEINI
tara:strand:- start:178 stop:696 length:519 start_codon:yes stop_codon:yes gene_type:complete